MASPAAAAASFVPDVPGTYVAAVRVSDGHTPRIAYVTVRALAQYQSSVSLAFAPGLVRYSTGLDKLVLTSVNPNALRIVDPFTGLVRSVPLPAAVKSLNLSADGKLAAVLHEGVVSLVDVDAGTLIRSSATAGSQTDAYVTNAGIVFLIGQTGGQWVSEPVVTLDGRTGVRIAQAGGWGGFAFFYGTQIGVMADRLNKVFFLALGLSPSDISYFTFDRDSSQVTASGDSPYHGDFPMTSPLYLSGDQGLVFTAFGNYFNTGDLRYAGQLIGVSTMQGFQPFRDGGGSAGASGCRVGHLIPTPRAIRPAISTSPARSCCPTPTCPCRSSAARRATASRSSMAVRGRTWCWSRRAATRNWAPGRATTSSSADSGAEGLQRRPAARAQRSAM